MQDRDRHPSLFPGQVGPHLPAVLLALSPNGGCMKLAMTKPNKYLLTGGLLLLTATPSFALFGIGDIVFDPTSYASLVQQLTTLQMQYNVVKNNLSHFSLKQQWQTALTRLENVNVANLFGETAGISIALKSN